MVPEFGRNQWIGLVGFGVVILLGMALVVAGHLAGETWYVGGLGAIGSLIGVGGVVNVAKARASEPAPPAQSSDGGAGA